MRRRALLRLLGFGAADLLTGCGGSSGRQRLTGATDPIGARDAGSPSEPDAAASSIVDAHSPAACVEAGRVIVLGGGVSGMSAAHELAERGFEVSVYELRDIAGGKARSMGKPNTGVGGRRDLPGEHGFRFFPAFYKHLPDTMKRIPTIGANRTVFDNFVPATRFLLSQAGKPDAEFPVRQREVDDFASLFDFAFGPNVTEVPAEDMQWFLGRLERFLKSCDARRLDEYERTSWWDYVEGDKHSEGFRRFLAGGLTRTLVAVRAERMSARSAASVLVQLLQDMIASSQGMDRVLNGPTNEVWIDPWLRHLRAKGVTYHTDTQVEALELESGRIRAAIVSRHGVPCRVEGELFISALPVEVTRRLVTQDMLVAAPELDGLSRLQTEWMNGIQYYLSEDIPIVHGHATFFDSPWALTAISQKQFWGGVDLSQYGDGSVRGVLSVDVSDWNTPGILYGKPARECTAEQIRNEVWAQLDAHWDEETRARFQELRVVDSHLDPAIQFALDGRVENTEPLLINTVGAYFDRPEATTSIANLFLAGDYVRTNTDLACMEGANESARRAVNGVLEATGSQAEPCAIWPLSEPALYAPARAADELKYALGLPPD